MVVAVNQKERKLHLALARLRDEAQCAVSMCGKVIRSPPFGCSVALAHLGALPSLSPVSKTSVLLTKYPAQEMNHI